MRVLGLDLSQFSAAAWREGDSFASEVRWLGKRGNTDAHCRELRDWLGELLLVVDPELVVVETDVRRGVGERTLEAYRRAAFELCRAAGVRAVLMSAVGARRAAFGEDYVAPAAAITRALTTLRIEHGASTDEIDACILVAAAELQGADA